MFCSEGLTASVRRAAEERSLHRTQEGGYVLL